MLTRFCEWLLGRSEPRAKRFESFYPHEINTLYVAIASSLQAKQYDPKTTERLLEEVTKAKDG